MKILLTLFVLFFSSSVVAKTYNLICLNKENNFQRIYEINKKNKSIQHLTSYNYDTEKKYNVYEFEKVFNWSSEMINFGSLTSSGTFSYGTYAFDTNLLISTGHYHHLKLTGKDRLNVNKYVFNQIYQCVEN